MKQNAFYLDVGIEISFKNKTVMDFVSASNYKHSAVSGAELDILKDLTELS